MINSLADGSGANYAIAQPSNARDVIAIRAQVMAAQRATMTLKKYHGCLLKVKSQRKMGCQFTHHRLGSLILL